MWEHFSVARPYCHAPRVCTYLLIFIIHILYWLCLAKNMEYNFQSWPFEDAESQPLLGYPWMSITNITGTLQGRYMTHSNAFDCITSTQVRQYLFTCRIFSSINKCWKFTGYLAAIWDRWGPRYDPQRHLHAWLGPMDGCAPAHFLLHSGVTLAYPCGAPVWRAADCYRAARGNEWASAQVPYTLNLCLVCFTRNLSGSDINLWFLSCTR
jgi:hypothetical protein